LVNPHTIRRKFEMKGSSSKLNFIWYFFWKIFLRNSATPIFTGKMVED
jgi:hypothetical protein